MQFLEQSRHESEKTLHSHRTDALAVACRPIKKTLLEKDDVQE
jgi:hypothetical protein